MMPEVTAVVCTYSPRREHLEATLDSLRNQTLDQERWEFILVDNNSPDALEGRVDLSWHPQARVVREEQPGLTHARLRSFRESRAPLIVYIDDDNVLAPDYLERAVALFAGDAQLGVAGGKSLPRYEVEPPAWFHGLDIDLACRDLGDEVLTASWEGVPLGERSYPACAPIGAGMVIRKEAYATYVEAAAADPVRRALGRTGESLASGEDNDIVMSALAEGWRVGYFPSLSLTHLISAGRLTRAYLARMAYSSSRTWVLVLGVHGVRPWAPISSWSVPLRKTRAYLSTQAWRNDASYVRWRGACGLFEGRALLSTL